MRTFVLLAILSFAFQAASQSDYGSIEGVVTRLDTNEPISGAQVVAGDFSATTDRQGDFKIDNILPGAYDVSVSAGRYLISAPLSSSVFFGQRVVAGNNIDNIGSAIDISNQQFWRVAIEPNTHISNLHLRMVSAGTISGKVVNSRGEAVPNVSVVLLVPVYRNGQTRLFPLNWRMPTQTNDRGEYRIFTLPPGQYCILAHDRTPLMRALSPTYFPGKVTVEEAAYVTVKEGEETSRMDIVMGTGTPRTISGIIDPPFQGRPSGITLITPIPRNTSTLVGSSYRFGAGQFKIGSTLPPPGEFDLFAVVTNQNRDYFGQAFVPPGTTEGITIEMKPGFDVTGQVTSGDGAALPQLESARIDMLSMTRIPYDTIDRESKMAPILDSRGGFTIQDMPSGRFSVVASLPSGMYVADIRQNGKSVMETGIAIAGKRPDPIDVIVNSDGATVAGFLLDAQDQRVGFNTVVLVPEPSRRQNFNSFQTVNADYDGHFSFSSVPPGKYEIFAWYGAPDGAWVSASFMEKFIGRGTVVELKQKDRIVDLRVHLTRNE